MSTLHVYSHLCNLIEITEELPCIATNFILSNFQSFFYVELRLLYSEADKSQLIDLEGIEKTVRSQILELVSPEIALFLLKKKQEQK